MTDTDRREPPASRQGMPATPRPGSPRGRRRPQAPVNLLLLGVGVLLLSLCDGFVPALGRTAPRGPWGAPPTEVSMVNDYDLRDPDMVELMMGGVRYENVPLPDSMLDTTLFVGNLCEFVRDEDLSEKFRSVTNLQSLPACVARRPNSQSLRYGFVAFPTVEEKEEAIIRFHGVEFQGRRLKVENILDHPSKGRVNVPEKLVTYVLGAAKKTPRGKNDFSLRKTSNPSKSKRRHNGGGRHSANSSYGNGKSGSHNGKTQGGRKGDRKQKRANVKKRRRRERDRDFFF